MKRLLATLAVFLIALLPRLADLDAFQTPDEPRWVCRAANFRDALRLGRLDQTYQSEHPGVTTMILGALGLPPNTRIDWPRVCGTNWAQGDNPQPDLEFYAGRRLRSAGLFDARVPVAAANALIVAGMFWLAWQLWSPAGAFLGAMLVAFDPFYLGLSRLLHVDALPAGFMTLAILSLAIFLDDRRRPAGDNRGRQGARLGWLLLSGVFAGLAALGKSPSLILGPFTLVVLAVWAVQHESHRHEDGRRLTDRVVRRLLPAIAVWGLGWAITMFALWPAMWVAPIDTARNVLSAAVGYAGEGIEDASFFLGSVVHDPGPLFYPVTLWFRLMPLTLLGIVAGLWVVWRERRTGLRTLPGLGMIVLCVVMYAGLMTLGEKKADRYLIPVFPILDLFAGAALVSATRLIARQLRLPVAPAVAIVVSACLVVTGAMSLPHHPYYLTFYNPLAGGGPAAARAIRVGWGEGLDQAAHYLNSKPDARGLRVVAQNDDEFRPFFVGRTDGPGEYDPAKTDYIVLYVTHVQRNLDPELMADAQKAGPAEYTVRLHGIEYAWVYRNAARTQPPRPRSFVVPEVQHPVHADLGGMIQLLGYDLDRTQVAAGEKVVLTLYWQARGPMRRSYRVFTHLVDASGQTRAQHDGIPDGGSYPTDDWAEGEVVTDRHELLISPDTPPGDLLLGTGMYSKDGRLPAFDAAGQRFANDWIELGRVRVVGG